MLGNALAHLVEDVQPSTLRLRQRFAHDLSGDAADLDVHLQRGDAVSGPGDFEVHVTVVIFCAGDVGKDGVLVPFLHQSHRHTRHRRLADGTPASIKESEAPQTVAMEEDPFDSKMSETTRMV